MESVVTPEPTKRQPRRPRTQSLKARVDNNPFLYLVSVAVAVAVTVAGVQQFFAVQASKALEEKYQVEVKDLQTSLASINRGVEGSGNYLDVTTYLPPITGAAPKVSPSARFFLDDRFYASSNDTYWTYSKTTEGDWLNLLTGTSLPPQRQDAASVVPLLHLWRGRDQLSVDGSKSFKAVFPHITLQRFPIDDYAKIIGLITTESPGQLPPENADQETFIQAADRMFRGDVVGILFAGSLNDQMTRLRQDNKASVRLRKAQKLGNVLYAQLLIILKDVSVDQQPGSQLYVTREVIIVSDATDVYFITTFVPSRDPALRGEPFTQVTKWLGDLAIAWPGGGI